MPCCSRRPAAPDSARAKGCGLRPLPPAALPPAHGTHPLLLPWLAHLIRGHTSSNTSSCWGETSSHFLQLHQHKRSGACFPGGHHTQGLLQLLNQCGRVGCDNILITPAGTAQPPAFASSLCPEHCRRTWLACPLNTESNSNSCWRRSVACTHRLPWYGKEMPAVPSLLLLLQPKDGCKGRRPRRIQHAKCVRWCR